MNSNTARIMPVAILVLMVAVAVHAIWADGPETQRPDCR